MLYERIKTPAGVAFYREDVIESLRSVDAVVMDVDGTLVDTTESLTEAIISTVNTIMGWLTGIRLTGKVIRRAISELRGSGGFNNDWDTTYTIIIAALSALSENLLEGALARLKEGKRPEANDRNINEDEDTISFEVLRRIEDAVKVAGGEGIIEVEKKILDSCGGVRKRGLLMKIREALGYSFDRQSSLLVSIFDEIYCGSKLYSILYNRSPILGNEPGLIFTERVIVDKRVLRFLFERADGKLGIVSGRPRLQATLVLKDLLTTFFDDRAVLFYEDLIFSDDNGRARKALKPHPYGLIRCLEALSPFELAVYVGDSAEDALLVENTRKLYRNVMFIGVYAYTLDPPSAIKTFMRLGAAAILPTVNEIVEVLR
ncbi:MAG: HAD family hydrolase [Candidatus Baldrarchaeia archaeon]